MEAIQRADFDWHSPRPGAFASVRPNFDTASFLRWLAGFLVAALLFCGAWLMLRRLTGSLIAPLEDVTLVGMGALVVLWAAAARLLWRHAAEAPKSSWQQRAMEWAPTVALVLAASSAVLPGSSPAAALVLWGMIAAEEVGASLLARLPARRTIGVADGPAVSGRAKPHPLWDEGRGLEPESPSTEVWQNNTRVRTAGGREVIRGTLRSALSAGQRIAIEHLVFCPLLRVVPRVVVSALDELDCSVRATHVYRYGARLEVKLREPCDEPVEVLVRYEVHG